jgi:hypothetical protein
MLSPIDCPFLLFSESMKCDVLFGPASIACVAGPQFYGGPDLQREAPHKTEGLPRRLQPVRAGRNYPGLRGCSQYCKPIINIESIFRTEKFFHFARAQSPVRSHV